MIELDFTPAPDLQVVAWLEDAQGQFVDTLFITEATGRYGLGNRPGIMEFNSEYLWPYGRRETVFPVWAHKRGVTYPRLVFQDGFDRDLSHAFSKSSTESYYCRPFRSDEPVRDRSIDTGTCATVAFTDKGKFDGTAQSRYPPRADLSYQAGTDHPDVLMFPELNDLDAVSRATPPGNAPYSHAVAIPGTVPDGEYTVWIEVSQEFDPNTHYRFPSPQLQAYGDYGEAYRGQPSIVWKAAVILDSTPRRTTVTDYAGYGDPDGVDGMLRTPDMTITSGVEGSGAGRLLLTSGEGGMYRFAVSALASDAGEPPSMPQTMSVIALEPSLAKVSFIEPANPSTGGKVKGFEVRLGLGKPLTPDNVTEGRIVPLKIVPAGPGTVQTIEIGGLLPETQYWIAIRAQDECLTSGSAAVIDLVTPRFDPPAVAACFVATAAYGSPMMAEVGLLRGFRDRLLRRVVVGEIFVETYYTFGPALAGVIRPSPTLRQLARGALAPLVDLVRELRP